jgi:hypothetical protein
MDGGIVARRADDCKGCVVPQPIPGFIGRAGQPTNGGPHQNVPNHGLKKSTKYQVCDTLSRYKGRTDQGGRLMNFTEASPVAFLYPTDPEILDDIVEFTARAHRASESSPVTQMPIPPSREQLRELLQCSFAASLETEEGRTIAFTLSFFADPSLDSHSIGFA